MTSFGKRLRKLRLEKDITMAALAKVIGTTQPTISKYERGIHEPDLPMVKALAQYFNVSVDYITGVTDNRDPYYTEMEDDTHEVRALVAKEGIDISDLSNEEIAKMIVKYHRTRDLYKSD